MISLQQNLGGVLGLTFGMVLETMIFILKSNVDIGAGEKYMQRPTTTKGSKSREKIVISSKAKKN